MEAAKKLQYAPASAEPPAAAELEATEVPAENAAADDSRWRWFLLVALISVLGAASTFLLSDKFRAHVDGIKSHFATGNWETRTEKASVETFIRAQHNPMSEWLVSFVAGSGHSFGLDADAQEQTIHTLGWALLTDDRNALTISDTPLPAAYGSLLADSIEEIAFDKPIESRTALSVFAQLMRNPAPNMRANVGVETYRRANEILRALPTTNPLVQALGEYRLFEFDAGLQFPAFDVATNPPYDFLAWKKNAQTLSGMQSNRCVADVTPLYGTANSVSAVASTYPRVLKLTIDRPWLNARLLDLKQRAAPLAAKHFNATGSLRIIPTYLWVLMPQEVRLEFQDKGVKTTAHAWANAKNCCKIVCGDTQVRLEARSVMEREEDGLLAGDIDGSNPILFAVASRRRAPN